MYPESEMFGCDCDYLRAPHLPTLGSSSQILRPCPQFWCLGQEKVIWVTNEREISSAAPAKLLIPFSWCWDQIIAGFLSTLISMTQPGHAYAHLTLLDGYYPLSRVYLEQAQCNIYSSHDRVSQIKHPERSLVMSESEIRDLGAIHQDGAVKVCCLLIVPGVDIFSAFSH